MEGAMDGFEEWWKSYPKKVAKGDARRAWLKTAKIRPELPEMLKAIEAAKRCEAWQKDGGAYIPHGATYLHGERWSDEYEVTLTDPKEWYETSTGIEAMGATLGITPDSFANWPQFKAEVMKRATVTPITRAA